MHREIGDEGIQDKPHRRNQSRSSRISIRRNRRSRLLGSDPPEISTPLFALEKHMAFGVRILTISSAARVPTSDRLSVSRVLGYDAVSANQEDGSALFADGERVIYVPEGRQERKNVG